MKLFLEFQLELALSSMGLIWFIQPSSDALLIQVFPLMVYLKNPCILLNLLFFIFY